MSCTSCILPYIHLYAEPNGEVKPCCIAGGFKEKLSLRDSSVDEVFNSPQMKELRKTMEEGERHPACNVCYEREDRGEHSPRKSFNSNSLWKMPLVNEDYSVTTDLQHVDIRFSNLCNFKCRTCGPDLSSSWYEDNVKLYGPLKQPKIIRPYKDEETFWQKVEPYMDGLEEIYFAGGEPLIMEEHYRILKKLDERKMYHVRLKYNTNFSQMTFKKLDVMEIWNRFESVKIGASLDGMGKRGEYLRKGQSWQQVEDNRKRMFDVCPDVYIFLATCLNVYNCLSYLRTSQYF